MKSDIRDKIIGYLDDDFEVSIDFLKSKGWSALPIVDIPNPMEVEWLYESILAYVTKELVIYIFEYQTGFRETKKIINKEEISAAIFENSAYYLIITDEVEKFLIFIDQANRYFLVCGDQDFLKSSYRTSYSVAKEMYFMHWEDDPMLKDSEKEYFRKIWNKYES